MSMDLNRVMLIGRLTQDPEVKQLPSGQSVCSVTVATSRRWKNPAGELQERSEFNNVVLWRRLAEIAGQYLKKGSKLYVEGHLETRSWDAKDGSKRYRTEIIADNIIMLDSKAPGAPSAPPMTASTGAAPAAAAGAAAFMESAPSPLSDTPPSFSEDELKIDEIPF